MTNARNSTYPTHSVADAHLLAMLDDKQDIHGNDTQSSRLSALFSTKLLETILIVPSGASCKHGHEVPGTRLSATSFDDMQRTVRVIGLPKPEKSKLGLKRSPESENIIDDAAVVDPFQGHDYDPEPQMQYRSPSQGSIVYAPDYRQQGYGHRHPTYCGPCGRPGYYGYGGGYGAPQRPPQAYFPGGKRQRRYGGGYYYGAGGCGCSRGGYPGCGPHYTQRPVFVRRHGGCCCCCC